MTLGAWIYDFAWINDFAIARNCSLPQAEGDWILAMDADEVVFLPDYASLENIVAKKDPKPVARTLVIRNFMDEVTNPVYEPIYGKSRDRD